MGSVWAEGGGDVVPVATGEADEGVAGGLEDEEVGVGVLFDGEEDEFALIFELDRFGRRGSLFCDEGGGGVCLWGLVLGGLVAGGEQDGEDEPEICDFDALLWGMQGHEGG